MAGRCPQLANHLNAVFAAWQTVIGHDHIGYGTILEQLERRDTRVGHRHFDPPRGQQTHQRVTHQWIVLNHQHPQPRNVFQAAGAQRTAPLQRKLRGGQGHTQAEAGATAHAGAHLQPVAEQLRAALDNTEPQPLALFAITLAITHLVELFEDGKLVLRRNANATVPDLDAHMLSIKAGPTGQQHAARCCVAQGVAQQIEQNPMQQGRVAQHPNR